jgi:hypothetical protein
VSKPQTSVGGATILTNPRLAVVDSRTVVEVKTAQLSPEERREAARRAIAEAFAERSPLVIAGEYRVVGGREVPVAHQQAKDEPPDESSD